MDIVVLRDENERLKEQLAQTQAALAESEEARRRLESIIVDVRRETFGAKSEKLRPDQYHLPLEDVEVAQGVLNAAQEKAAAIIKGKSDDAARTSNRNRGQLPAHLPRVERIIEPKSTLCPWLRRDGEDRRGCERAAGRDPSAIARACDASSEIRLPSLFGSCGAGACTRARGARRPAD